VNSVQNKWSCLSFRLVSQNRFDCVGNSSVGVFTAQENTSRNRVCVSEVDGNGSVFCRVEVLGFSTDQSFGSSITFLEEGSRSLCEDTARPSPGETKDSRMSVWMTSDEIEVSSGFLPSFTV
jgi:hypothetical protein